MREERQLSYLRQSVAMMLSQSARTIPHAAGHVEFDVTPLIEYGDRVVQEFDQNGEKLTAEQITRKALHKNFSAFFIKTIAHVMHHVPELNGFVDWAPARTSGTFYIAEDINLSFTVHTKFGVVKPIVRNPHLKTLEQVANEMRILTRKSRRTDINELYNKVSWLYFKEAIRQMDPTCIVPGIMYIRSLFRPSYPVDPQLKDVPEEDRLKAEDILGATCTVANIGMAVRACQTVTVIIPPEVFMWGIGHTRLEPRVVNGQILPRHVVTVTCTFDHRALDGGDVFPLTEVMDRYISNPALIYEWKPGDPV
ncbi:MAG: hypothetical protein AMXMBFR84_22970 [Candidatus Hydrogenedentota bacterium]